MSITLHVITLVCWFARTSSTASATNPLCCKAASATSSATPKIIVARMKITWQLNQTYWETVETALRVAQWLRSRAVPTGEACGSQSPGTWQESMVRSVALCLAAHRQEIRPRKAAKAHGHLAYIARFRPHFRGFQRSLSQRLEFAEVL